MDQMFASLPKFYVEDLTPNVTVFEDRAFTGQSRLSEVIKCGGSNLI